MALTNQREETLSLIENTKEIRTFDKMRIGETVYVLDLNTLKAKTMSVISYMGKQIVKPTQDAWEGMRTLVFMILGNEGNGLEMSCLGNETMHFIEEKRLVVMTSKSQTVMLQRIIDGKCRLQAAALKDIFNGHLADSFINDESMRIS